MATVNLDLLIPHMDAYKTYLDNQDTKASSRPFSNAEEDYKRDIADKAAGFLEAESWTESDIGSGTIGERSIKAVQRNLNLIGRFQVSGFSDKVRESGSEAERLLYDLYHDHKEQECFDRICDMFGRKYDLVAYLYFILDPKRYLPLRSTIFDGIFKRLGIDLQTAGRCSWENYQDFIDTIAAVRDAMKDHFKQEDIDLLDAHSFLWTINMDVLGKEISEGPEGTPQKEKVVDTGVSVFHKDYGEGTISKLTDDKVYVEFEGKQRIFPYPDAFEKEYLTL